MKKIILIITGGVLMTVSMFGQGTLSFQNGGTSAFYFQSTDPANKVTSAELGQQPLSGSLSTGVLDVGLFWSFTSFNNISGGTLAGIENIAALPSVGNVPGVLNGISNFQIAGTNPNDSIFIQIYAWDSAYGNSQAGLEACLAAGDVFMACSAGAANTAYGFIGNPLKVTLGPTAGPGTPIFGTLSTEFGKTVYVTPEPGTIVLGSLGAAALLLFRRRK